MQQILISRFLTNLRQASEGPSAASGSYDHGASRFSHNFRVPTSLAASIVGPAGEPLEFGHPAAPWDDLDEQPGVDIISGDRPLGGALPSNAPSTFDDGKPDTITVRILLHSLGISLKNRRRFSTRPYISIMHIVEPPIPNTVLLWY